METYISIYLGFKMYKIRSMIIRNHIVSQSLELALKEDILGCEKWLGVVLEQQKQMTMLKSCQTVQEIFAKQKNIYPGLIYRRIPLTDCCAPKEEVTHCWFLWGAYKLSRTVKVMVNG